MIKAVFKPFNLFLFIIFILGLYGFVYFDDWMTPDFTKGTIGAKHRMRRFLVFIITKNKVGYWIVRGGILLLAIKVGVLYIKEICEEIVNNKELV